jgi:hypothetical protein
MKGGVSRGIEEGGNAYPRNELVDPSFTNVKEPSWNWSGAYCHRPNR